MITANRPGEPAKAARHPDLGTVLGLGLSVAGVLGGLVLEGGQVRDILQPTAGLIVLGGTLGAVLVTNTLGTFWRAVRRLRTVFMTTEEPFKPVIDELITYAAKARKHGIAALETNAAAIQDDFFCKALSLAVDGIDVQEIRSMMELEILAREQAIRAEARVWEAAGGYAPTVGIIGAVLGLIQVMKNLENITAVGHGIAVSFVATVYGVALANLFFLPAAGKIKIEAERQAVSQELILEGVIAIAQGSNPKLIRSKLDMFGRPPAMRGNDNGVEFIRGARADAVRG